MMLQKISIFLFLFCFGNPLHAAGSTDSDQNKVRIGLRLTAFSKQKMPSAPIPHAIARYSLKARISQSDDFYFDGIHVQAVPGAQTNDKKSYRVRLIFGKQNSAGKEETLGSLDLQGRLQRDGSSYILIGLAEQGFRDKAGEPVLNVLAGFRQDLEVSPSLAGNL